MSESIFHIAEADKWRAALAAGEYRWSTLDRTLEEEGFIHASEAHQWEATLERFYAAYEGGLMPTGPTCPSSGRAPCRRCGTWSRSECPRLR